MHSKPQKLKHRDDILYHFYSDNIVISYTATDYCCIKFFKLKMKFLIHLLEKVLKIYNETCNIIPMSMCCCFQKPLRNTFQLPLDIIVSTPGVMLKSLREGEFCGGCLLVNFFTQSHTLSFLMNCNRVTYIWFQSLCHTSICNYFYKYLMFRSFRLFDIFLHFS